MFRWTQCNRFVQECFPHSRLSDRAIQWHCGGWRSGKDHDFLLGMKNLMEHVECNWKISGGGSGGLRRGWPELAEQCKEGEGRDHGSAVAPTNTLDDSDCPQYPHVRQTKPNAALRFYSKEGQEATGARNCFCLTNGRMGEWRRVGCKV